MSGAFEEILRELGSLELAGLYERDFTNPEAKGPQALAAVFAAADALRELREKNYDVAVFTSGLALWEGAEEEGFAAFAAAAALMGLQTARVETLDEVTLARAGADVVCAREDRGILCDRLYRAKVLNQRPLSLPRETALPLVLDAIHQLGGVRELRDREVPLPPRIPSDLPLLFQDFGLTAAGREMGPLELWRMERLRPYIFAGMILLGMCPEPVKALRWLQERGRTRRFV